MAGALDPSQIKGWQNILTLIVFVMANVVVLFPFHIPIYFPRLLSNLILDCLSALRFISPREDHHGQKGVAARFVRLRFPMNFMTAPLAADLFLLAIQAIGRSEVYGGTLGSDNIVPIDIMLFFLTLAYIAVSIDASGLIRFLAFKVLQKGGKVGHRLFFLLYAFFFALGSFIGNDPIILSGTAFLAYMTRVSSNIEHPRAWIHTQFAVANIASAILVSSNPTNLVLAGAFGIKFTEYTANIIVPVLITAIVLFPFLLYIVFADNSLIPYSIKMHELSEEAKAKKPINPNIPHARGDADEQEYSLINDEQVKLISLEEVMNPFLDKGGATFGGIVMAATLATLLAINASTNSTGEHPVFWVTLPAAFVMFCWDMGFGWYHRHETREISRKGRQEFEKARAERALREALVQKQGDSGVEQNNCTRHTSSIKEEEVTGIGPPPDPPPGISENGDGIIRMSSHLLEPSSSVPVSRNDHSQNDQLEKQSAPSAYPDSPPQGLFGAASSYETAEKKRDSPDQITRAGAFPPKSQRATVASLVNDAYRWSQETFPTVTAVFMHLPFPLVPFALSMFVLVQGLVTKGWVLVFAYGWDHWVNKTGTIGAIGGMGFLSVLLCNFAGTNIGTTILLSRVVQSWQTIHYCNGIPLSSRTFWATIYAMALGVNYGAFSTAFSASLAGILWRDILLRKHIRVGALEFARVNLPIIAIAMSVGCAVLIGEVYIVRTDAPFDLSSLAGICQ